MIIIGIDPDSKAHGVAVYMDGELEELHTIALPALVYQLKSLGAIDRSPSTEIGQALNMHRLLSRSALKRPTWFQF